MALTPAQEFHNSMLDLEIDQAHRYNKMVDDENNRKIAEWEKFLKDNPNHPYKSCPNLDIRSPKKVIGIRYVE